MSRNNFGSGFVVGSILGGVVGGVLGTLLATRDSPKGKTQNTIEEGEAPLDFSSEENMELARHSLEDKIAQLNSAIDEVRQQLGSVNGKSADLE